MGSGEHQMAEYGQQLKEAFAKIQTGPPAIFLLNKFALNISLNFVCNLRQFPGVAQRLVAITFDGHSSRVLRQSFPDIGIIQWHLPALEEKFSSGDGRYQLFQLFRAKLASLLTEITSTFWMIQADTIWRENLFEIIKFDAGEYADADLVFDSEGSNGLLRHMIAGGYFFTRSSNRTKKFFDSLAHFLLDHFATDNNVMARQCILGLFGNKCAHIPYSVISNWRESTTTTSIPQNGQLPSPLFQFDGGDRAIDKFEKMQSQGYLFVDPATIPSEQAPNEEAKVKCLTEEGRSSGKMPVAEGQPNASSGNNGQWRANDLMAFVHSTFEFVNARFPSLKELLLTNIFPYYAAYLFI